MKKILESDDDGEIGDSFETTVDHPPVIIKVQINTAWYLMSIIVAVF